MPAVTRSRAARTSRRGTHERAPAQRKQGRIEDLDVAKVLLPSADGGRGGRRRALAERHPYPRPPMLDSRAPLFLEEKVISKL
jgi:hypothetical protein